MIQIKDQKEEEEAIKLELEEIRLKYHRLLLKIELEIRHRELMESQNKRLMIDQSQQEVPKSVAIVTDKEKDMDLVMDTLRSVMTRGSIIQEGEEQKKNLGNSQLYAREVSTCVKTRRKVDRNNVH